MGYRALLADGDTTIVADGDECFEVAKSRALDYLRQRLARRRDENAARLASLRLALLRVEAMTVDSAL